MMKYDEINERFFV